MTDASQPTTASCDRRSRVDPATGDPPLQQDAADELARLYAYAAEADRERVELRRHVETLKRRVEELKSQPSYRLAAPLRLIERTLASLRKRSLGANLRRLARVLRGRHFGAAADVDSPDVHYRAWIAENDRLSEDDRAAIARDIAAMADAPTIAVVMPVRDPPPPFLAAAIASVRAQMYPHWQLCIADDASQDPAVRTMLADAARDDQRIRLVRCPAAGGIARASNAALALADAPFAALLDHDDVLAPHALYLVADALRETPDVNLIYSDEDVIDEHGSRRLPYFKPDWNPDLMLGQNMVSHLGCYRLALVRALGGFRDGFEGSQDWDLALRVAARSSVSQIRHLPFVLYHWRRVAAGGSFSMRNIEIAAESARRAVRDALHAAGHNCGVRPIGHSSFQRVHWPLPTPAPKVSVIVPTRDRLDLLARCIEGLRRRTDYPALEIIVVDNGSVDRRTLDYIDALAREGAARVLRHPGEFDYAAINNEAAAIASGTVLALLNNDVEPLTAGWLQEMVANAMRPDIGAVGALLRYPDGSIQHGGVAVHRDGPFHLHRHYPSGSTGYFGRLAVQQDVRAVTGACMVLRKSVFDEVGGFDPSFRVDFNDVDLCMRIGRAGYRIVWTPFAELMHRESATRGARKGEAKERARRELALLLQRWDEALGEDPAHSPNLAVGGWDFAERARVKRRWRAR